MKRAGRALTAALAIGLGTPLAIGLAAPLAIGLAAPLAIGLAAPLAIGLAAPLAIGLATPLAIGLATPLAIGLATPAHADVDTDFAGQLHTYGIYGPRDYNAWLAKIVCERLGSRLDPSADKSAQFIFHNLPRGTSTEQSWQFLASAINFYCPDQMAVLQTAAAQHQS